MLLFLNTKETNRVFSKPCLTACRAHAYAPGASGRPAGRNRWAATVLGNRHRALTLGKGADRLSDRAALGILSPHQAGGHNEHLPPFPPHQRQRHLTETEKPRTSPPCGPLCLILGHREAWGKEKSQCTSRKLLLLLHASHIIHLLLLSSFPP